MFNWFNRNEEPEKLCSMCKRFKPIKTADMGDEFCFICVAYRAKQVLDGTKCPRECCKELQ